MKKLKNACGMTIVEMLIAVMLLALLTAGGVTATTAVMASYTRMSDVSNAEILASTVVESLSNEIRLGRNIQVVNSTGAEVTTGTDTFLRLDSAVFGDRTTLQLDANGHLVAKTVTGTDPIIPILTDHTYSGLKLKDLSFEKSGDAFKISFTVYSDHLGDLWNGSVTVSSMYAP